MSKLQKLYYVPGIISLIVLPIIYYYYFLPIIKKEERIIQVEFLSSVKNSHNYPESSMKNDTTLLSLPRLRRNYLDIQIGGNETQNKLKLDLFRFKIREIINNRDTANGVHLKFLENCKYGAFVESLNICEEEGAIRMALFENNLWVLNFKNDKSYMLERRKIKKDQNERRNARETQKNKSITLNLSDWFNLIKINWMIFIAFLVLSYLSINKTIKFLK